MMIMLMMMMFTVMMLYLAESEMDTGRLTDVHDLAVGGKDKDEAVKSLEEVRAELLHEINTTSEVGLHAPTIAETWT